MPTPRLLALGSRSSIPVLILNWRSRASSGRRRRLARRAALGGVTAALAARGSRTLARLPVRMENVHHGIDGPDVD
jgi:hypothetical protein